MNIWIPIIGLSSLTGIGAGFLVKSRWAIVIGGALPWFGLLGWLLYNEYYVPYQGGGASMWPIAQLFAGSIAAAVGASAAGMTRMIVVFNRESPNRKKRP